MHFGKAHMYNVLVIFLSTLPKRDCVVRTGLQSMRRNTTQTVGGIVCNSEFRAVRDLQTGVCIGQISVWRLLVARSSKLQENSPMPVRVVIFSMFCFSLPRYSAKTSWHYAALICGAGGQLAGYNCFPPTGRVSDIEYFANGMWTIS